MKFLTTLFNFYIQSSIHVSLAVTSLAVISVMDYGFVPEPALLLFIFLGTITGYNFVKYAGISNRHNLKITPFINLIRIFTVLALLGTMYFARLLPQNVIIMAAIFGGLTMFYAIPIYKKQNLRSLSGAKIFIIALVWMGIAVLVPLEYHNLNLFTWRIFFHCLEILLFVIALTLPFEIRDLKYDEPELATIPQKLGVQKAKLLGSALLIIAGVITFQRSYIGDIQPIISVIIFALTMILIWISKKDQGKYFAAFWVESVPTLWLLLLLLF